MAEKDIFERDRSGEIVDMNDPEFYRIYDVIHDTMAKLQRMNSSVMSAEEVRQVFADVTGRSTTRSRCSRRSTWTSGRT